MSLKKDFEQIESIKNDHNQYVKGLQTIISKNCEMIEENLKVKEQAIINLGKFYEEQNEPQKIYELVVSIKQILNEFPKAKAAKILKILIELNEKNSQSRDLSIKLCQYLINWCTEEKRTYLKHRIEIKLSNLFWHQESYQQALEITSKILEEVRKADDKHLLVEIELVQSKIYHSLENLAKAKASLTAARSCANSIYCPFNLQAEIDFMSGILQAEDQDYKTGFSYFYESFEAFNQSNDQENALKSLKLVILCKIMMNQLDDVNSLLNGKYGLKYQGPSLTALREIAQAHGKRKLQEFSVVLNKYENEITKDRLIKNYINTLYENLMEQNLMSIIKPYSHVQIEHISRQINLSVNEIQCKLSEMILDKKIEGTLDQENNCLILFEFNQNDKLYDNALQCIDNTSIVVDKLFEKYRKVKAM